MRVYLAVVALGVLAACAPPIPDSGPELNSAQAQRERDAALANPGLPSPYALSSEPLSAVGTPATGTTGTNADIAAQTTAALAATSANFTAPPVQPVPSIPAPVNVDNAGISSENDFEIVSGQQTIESDAARLASNRDQYTLIQPTELPTRSGASQPNIVAFALQTSNPRGVQVHSRSGVNLQARMQRNCARYASPDLAQIDFLQSGGPERDRKTLDPDGDGFACSWDPAPFRAAVKN